MRADDRNNNLKTANAQGGGRQGGWIPKLCALLPPRLWDHVRARRGKSETDTAQSSNERNAALLGLIVLAIAFVWMSVLAVQRPVTYSELAETAPWPDARLNINTATEAELTVLPGIGPRLAERIVSDREMNGPFDSLDDLTRVPMIGPRTVESIMPYVMVRPAEDIAGARND